MKIEGKSPVNAIFFFTILVALQGCVVTTGRRIPLGKLTNLEVGKTTAQEVVTLFGPPENIAENTLDHTLIYAYQWIVSKVIGIGIPPWIIVAHKADNGYQVNIAFINGLYSGHAVTTFKQKLFKREKSLPEKAAP